MIRIGEAIASLCPGASWSIQDDVYEQIIWHSPDVAMPTKEQVEAEITRLEGVAVATQYKQSRQREYPPITDYIDGVVKGDQAQIDAYIAACQAVKAKYPKPE